MTRIYTYAIIVMMMMGSLTHVAVAQNVTFTDANLAAAVRDALGLAANAPIPQATLERDLTTLEITTATNPKISSLAGLQYATALTRLVITNQALTTLAPIRAEDQSTNTPEDLPNLVYLDLSHNQLTNIVWTTIRHKEHLEVLRINHNQLTRLDNRRLRAIKIIEANYNAIRSLVFTGRDWPEKLELQHNGMTAIPSLEVTFSPDDPFFDSPNQQPLVVQYVPFFAEIGHIDFSNNQISDLSPLDIMRHLFRGPISLAHTLDLRNNNISDISQFRRHLSSTLQRFPHLEKLYLSGNPICDLTPLEGMTKLCYLDVDPCPEASFEDFGKWIPSPNGCNLTFEIVSGNRQTAQINQPLANPLVVKVQDDLGNRMGGVTVRFSVSPSNGRLTDTSVTTDADGVAQTELTLGSTAGTYTITANATDISQSVSFTATAIAPPRPTTLEIVSGDRQSAQINQSLTNRLVVKVKDQYGDPMRDVIVMFSVSPTNGRLRPTRATTSEQGEASTLLQLGNTAGTYTVTARVANIAQEVTFTATALPMPEPEPPPEPDPTPMPDPDPTPMPEPELRLITLEIVSGDRQSAQINQSLANPFVVKVRDPDGNPITDVTVHFSVNPSDGRLTLTSSDTDSTGEAQTILTLGSTVGTYTVTASVSGTSQSVSFTATATAAPIITLIPESPGGDYEYSPCILKSDVVAGLQLTEVFINIEGPKIDSEGNTVYDACSVLEYPMQIPQWFELLNTTDAPIDLEGAILRYTEYGDNCLAGLTGQVKITETFEIPAGQVGLIAMFETPLKRTYILDAPVYAFSEEPNDIDLRYHWEFEFNGETVAKFEKPPTSQFIDESCGMPFVHPAAKHGGNKLFYSKQRGLYTASIIAVPTPGYHVHVPENVPAAPSATRKRTMATRWADLKTKR